jgi:hypothetical protein
VRRARSAYGAGALHLVMMAICYLIALYAGSRLLARRPGATAGWFVGSALGHDLLLLPAYLLLDAALVAAWRRHPTVGRRTWLHHIRWPSAISLLLLLVFAPEILRIKSAYPSATDLSSAGFLGHWGEVVGVLFGLSALAFATRVLAGRLRR